MTAAALLGRITVVLHRTRTPENVGGAARALANMGLSRLVLADPAGFDLTRARRIAAEASAQVERAEVVPSLEDALPRFGLLVATTARARDDLPMVDPQAAAAALIEAAGAGVEVALLFGDERHGLPREILDRAHLVSRVPTAETTASLNLAMAVLVHAWELRRAALGPPPLPPAEPPLGADDLARLRERARALLLGAGYLNPQRPERIFGELERLLLRAHPTEREGRLLLALVRQLEWAVGRGPAR